MFKKILGAAAALIVALALYLSLWPVPIEPVVWSTPPFPYNAAYVGAHARNTKLANLKHISIGTEEGPEHIMLGPDGKLYAAVASGAILRMAPDGSQQSKLVSTGGRVLGFDFDAAGNLIAADALRGLLSIAPDGKLTVLTDKVSANDPIRYADAVVVAKTGKMYFTDASQRFGPKEWGGTFEASVLDIIEHSSTGRVLEYDPATKVTRVVFTDLCFANGIALSKDQRHLFVNETGAYRTWKVEIGPAALSAKMSAKTPSDKARVLLDNLPGYPDNLMRGQGVANQDRIWLGFAKPRGKAIDDMAGKPFLRKLTLRLPRALWPVPPTYGHVIAFDDDGKIVADLQDPAGSYPETTAITETDTRLYVQSLHAKTLGWIAK